MHRLVRIEGLHDFKVDSTLKFVLYDGSKCTTLKGSIHSRKYIDFDNHHDSVDILFSGFGIKEPLQYCKKFDPECSSGKFPEHSSLDALKKTILSFFDLNTDITIPSKYKVEDEIVDSKTQIKEIRKSDSETFKVMFTKGNTKTLTVRDSGYLSGHNQVFKTCDCVVTDLSDFLYEELDCLANTDGYEPYINQKENIWIFIDDLKYRFGTEECKKTINPEFYKHLKKKPKQGIIEQIEYSQTKTQGNAYQFCKRRGTVCRGDVPEGRTVQGKRSKASVSSRSLAYRAVIGQ